MSISTDADSSETTAAVPEKTAEKRIFTDYSLPREVIEEANFYYPSTFKNHQRADGNLVLIIPKDIVKALDISHYSSTRAGKKSFRVIIVRTK